MTSLLRSKSLSLGKIFKLTKRSGLNGWAPLPRATFAKSMAIGQANAYWFSPSFSDGAAELSSKQRTPFLLTKRASTFQLYLAVPGPHHRSWLETRGGKIGIAWEIDTDAIAEDTPVGFLSQGSNAKTLIKNSVSALQPILRSFIRREDKMAAPFVDWFGWCTWDAFYQEVTPAGIKKGLQTFSRGGCPPRMLILDDGWQDTDQWDLDTHGTNSKFPNGLASVSAVARGFGVKHFGVWHALQGYWHGVSPKGPLNEHYRILDVPQNTTDFKEWPESFNPKVRHALHPDDMARFYHDYYASLKAAGVDFTKVDGQGATSYFAENTFPVAATIEAYQAAMQGAVANHMPSGSIHCMANTADILWRIRSASVWRNSDDFYPRKPFPDQAAHLVINAYNALFTGEFAIPDWDMFHSKHEFAAFHGSARALSGGPLYVSDKPGQHDFELLRRFVLANGRIPRFEFPGTPPEKWLFADPLNRDVPLVISNHSGPVAALGLFNCRRTATEIIAKWSVSDLPVLTGSSFIARDAFSGETLKLKKKQIHTDRLTPNGGFRIWTISPLISELMAPLGLEGMPAAAATIASVKALSENSIVVSLTHAGNHSFYCTSKPKSVSSGRKKIQFSYSQKSRIARITIPDAIREDLLFNF